MQSAAPKTYISRRMLDRYSEQRRIQQQEQLSETSSAAKTTAPVVPGKTFSEDEPQAQQQEPAAAQSTELAQIQEEEPKAEVEEEKKAAPQEEEKKEEVKAPVQEEKVKKGFWASLKRVFTSKDENKEEKKNEEKKEAKSATANEPPKFKKKKRQQSFDRNLSCEEMDSDDLDGDLNLSDEDSGQQNRRGEMRAQRRSAAPQQHEEDRDQYAVEFDTNVFKVSLECLQNRGQLVTGDAEFCKKCKAVFNSTSKLVEEEEGKQLWICEFCNERNEVMIGTEEIPQSTEVTYLLEATAQVEQTQEEEKKAGEKTSDKISVIFCIDVSGSMQQGGRLQMCKHAVAAQINQMHESNNQRKLGLVTFEADVVVIGDGIEKPQTIQKDLLHDYSSLLENGLRQADERMNKPICETKDSLLHHVGEMQVRGATCLGPAVLTSVAMASKGAPGSQVIILTDGMANQGIGSFSTFGQDSGDSNQFYEKVGRVAEEHGVLVNLVTIAGCEANISGLQRLIELSGGQIEQVNPNEIANDFANILSQKAIATKVEAKVKLHKGLQFRNELESDLTDEKTILTRRFGNVTTDSMFTFEYGMKAISQLLEMTDLDMATITHFPFQTQIKYTALNGDKCMRVITQKLEVSNEREELTNAADAELIQQNYMMQGAKQARAGNTRKAQAIMKTYQRKTKGLQTENWTMNRADFNAQAGEVYSAMNCQVNSLKAPQVDFGASKQTRSMRKSVAFQQPAAEQSQGDRFTSQMFQMSTKARRSKY